MLSFKNIHLVTYILSLDNNTGIAEVHILYVYINMSFNNISYFYINIFKNILFIQVFVLKIFFVMYTSDQKF